MTPDELKIGQVADRLIRASEHLLNDTNRLAVWPPTTKSSAVDEYQALIDQAERITLKAKDLKHEATGRF
ncbi:hypothetical protein QSU93_02630 [Limosilactobacillus fermentum]|uniref:hypothetical protein n=1 Tax=Limosilactobacillus fermentum TaxID=1613 RepID=UPI00256FC6E1|nr:hypothetical protein [Limosilactobacillus fermentum]WJD85292.1 hypothetical protein QSU93_02630 [Limosilactobacillus fermentum]